MSDESFKAPVTTNHTFVPELTFTYKGKTRAKSKGNFLVQDNAYFARGNVINLFIVYESDTWSWDLNTNFTLGDCLFTSVKL